MNEETNPVVLISVTIIGSWSLHSALWTLSIIFKALRCIFQHSDRLEALKPSLHCSEFDCWIASCHFWHTRWDLIALRQSKKLRINSRSSGIPKTWLIGEIIANDVVFVDLASDVSRICSLRTSTCMHMQQACYEWQLYTDHTTTYLCAKYARVRLKALDTPAISQCQYGVAASTSGRSSPIARRCSHGSQARGSSYEKMSRDAWQAYGCSEVQVYLDHSVFYRIRTDIFKLNTCHPRWIEVLANDWLQM